MEKRLYLTQTTTTARSQLRSWSRRCVQGDFTLGTLTDQSPLQVLQLILLTTILKATWQICQWEVEVVLGSVWVGVVAWTDRVEMVEPRVLVANPSNIWISAILFGIPNCSIPCVANGNSSRIGKLQQSKDWPGKGRRKRMPRNTSNLLASVLTNLLIIKIVFYYRSGHFFWWPIHVIVSLLDPYVLLNIVKHLWLDESRISRKISCRLGVRKEGWTCKCCRAWYNSSRVPIWYVHSTPWLSFFFISTRFRGKMYFQIYADDYEMPSRVTIERE